MGLQKYDYNIEFFENDSPELAYFLGFLMADGYVGRSIRFNINVKDVEILKYFNSLICQQDMIKYITYYNKGYNITCYKTMIAICSKKITKILVNKYGFSVGAKTGKEFIPNTQYKYDFIRGAFDGDGWISNISNKPHLFSAAICSASRQFLEDIQIICNNIGTIFITDSIFTWKMGTAESCKFRNLIYYKEDLFGLERKKSKLFKIDITKLDCNRFCKRDTIELIDLVNSGFSISDIAIRLNRTDSAISRKLQLLNLYEPIKPHYTKNEEDFIKKNYDCKNNKTSMIFIAEELGRTLYGIDKKVGEMKIRYLYHKFTEQEVDFIKQNRKMGIKWLSNELNLSYQSVSSKIGRMKHNA